MAMPSITSGTSQIRLTYGCARYKPKALARASRNPAINAGADHHHRNGRCDAIPKAMSATPVTRGK